jgi:hypothetical protein
MTAWLIDTGGSGPCGTVVPWYRGSVAHPLPPEPWLNDNPALPAPGAPSLFADRQFLLLPGEGQRLFSLAEPRVDQQSVANAVLG